MHPRPEQREEGAGASPVAGQPEVVAEGALGQVTSGPRRTGRLSPSDMPVAPASGQSSKAARRGGPGEGSPVTWTADLRVDAYIDALPGWQQAICREVRELVHAADPEVTETIKRTRQPYFVLQGNVCALLAA